MGFIILAILKTIRSSYCGLKNHLCILSSFAWQHPFLPLHLCPCTDSPLVLSTQRLVPFHRNTHLEKCQTVPLEITCANAHTIQALLPEPKAAAASVIVHHHVNVTYYLLGCIRTWRAN